MLLILRELYNDNMCIIQITKLLPFILNNIIDVDYVDGKLGISMISFVCWIIFYLKDRNISRFEGR